MSSVGSHYSQISARGKFFLPLAGAEGYYLNAVDTGVPNSVQYDLSGTEIPPDFDISGTVISGNLLKDLGRQVVLYDNSVPAAVSPGPTSQYARVAVWRQVQVQNGASTEGVGLPGDVVWVKTWSASGTDVYVVRTG
jgi:hypothetical protein